jgi:hypothetical protein
MRFMKFSLIAALLILLSHLAHAQGSLLYLEAQGVTGYSGAARDAIFYSMSQEDAMQKPSIGFDWLRRLSGESRDIGVAGLQARLAYNHEPDRELELQIYNAWFRYKAGFANLWIGHDRPALGLSSYFDTHGLLLPTLAMMGYGFDRDWGVGLARDFAWGNLAGSFTTGSGMPIYFKGNHLASARISKGVLEQENYNLGLSATYGKILETMGYELMSPDPVTFRMASIDLAYLWTRYESRLEFMAGERMDEPSYALFWRFGVNLLSENRLRLEAQPVLWKVMGESSYTLATGLSYQATADLAVRAMYEYADTEKENRLVAQVYYYRRM